MPDSVGNVQILSTLHLDPLWSYEADSLTLIQPVCDAVEDDALLSRRREPPRAALNIRLVVNVVFKDIHLWDRQNVIFNLKTMSVKARFDLFILKWI